MQYARRRCSGINMFARMSRGCRIYCTIWQNSLQSYGYFNLKERDGFIHLSVQAGFLAILRKSKRDFLSLPTIALNILPVLFGVALWGGIRYVFCDVSIAYATGLLPESLQAYINDNGYRKVV